MDAIRSIFVWLVASLATFLVTLPVCIASTLLYPLNPQRTWAHRIGILWAHLIFWVNRGWKVTITGKRHLPKGAAVFIANHESMADIIAVYLVGADFKWLAKESLFKVPFFGWSMRLCGYIPLRRGSLKSTAASMEQAREYLRKGIPILIFPEGTRSKDGKLGAFKGGAFKLAIEQGVPIVPVVIKGTRDVLEKGSWKVARKIHVTIDILEPIRPTAEPLDEKTLKETVRQEYERHLGR